MKKILLIVGIAVAVIAIAGIGVFKWGTGRYNQMITLGQNVDKSWGQVENVLQRRNDLIPNLVNVVQAYAIQEQEVFIKVAQARSAWMRAVQSGSIADKIQADSVVTGTLATLMATVEKYPDLKSNENFLALQDELAGTENRIAVERMRYNESVQLYNTAAKVFPNNLLVKFLSLTPERDYFKAVDGAQNAPVVNINVQQGTAATAVPTTQTQLPPPPTAATPFPPPPPANSPTVPQVIPATGITPPPPPPAPVAPVAPAIQPPAAAAPTPTAPVAPQAPATPQAAPVTQTAPATPVPAAPVAPKEPVAPAPTVAVPQPVPTPAPTAPVAPQAPATPQAAPVTQTAPATTAPTAPVQQAPSINVVPPAPVQPQAPATQPAAPVAK